MRPDPALGIFETVLVHRGRPVALAEHLARLASSVEALYAAAPPVDLADAASDRARSLRRPARLRIVYDGSYELEVAEAPESLLAVEAQPSLALRPLAIPGGLGAHKWRDRSALPDEPVLIVDPDGSVLEAGHANVFAVEGERLVTPPLDGRILPGVTRARVIALAADRGIEVEQAAVSESRLASADDAFLTSAIRGVQRVAGARAGSRVVDELTGALRSSWLDEVT